MKQGVKIMGQYLDEAQNLMVDVEMDLTEEQAKEFGLTWDGDYSIEAASSARRWPPVSPEARARLAQVLREVQG